MPEGLGPAALRILLLPWQKFSHMPHLPAKEAGKCRLAMCQERMGKQIWVGNLQSVLNEHSGMGAGFQAGVTN